MFRTRLARIQALLILALVMPIGPQFAWSENTDKPDNADAAEPSDTPKSAYTQDVLKIAYRYADGGGYIWKNSTGVSDTLTHAGQTILEKQPSGTYCCGFTLQVAFRLAQEHGLFDDKSVKEVKQFQRTWYGATSESGETQCTLAMQTLGVGHAVEHDDAKPGDFGNFWRTKSGHSIIFLNWTTDDDGNRTGIHYRSSQTATDGIGDHTEYFQGHGGKVDPARVYLCRFNEPEEKDEPKRGGNR